MATKPEAAEPAKSPAKSKKMLIIVVVAVLVLVLAAAGGWFYISKQRAAADEGEGEATTSTKAAGPPTFLPLDNMVVNLADPGGEKVAQVGITLEIANTQGVDMVKVYLPAIRSGILLLISQRTAEELLRREGKEKLAQDILVEASKPFGGGGAAPDDQADEGKKPVKKKAGSADNPVRAVLFSSFIVQ